MLLLSMFLSILTTICRTVPVGFVLQYLCRRKPSAPVVLDSDETYDNTLLLGESGHLDYHHKRKRPKLVGRAVGSDYSELPSVPRSTEEDSIPYSFSSTVREPEPVGLAIGISVQKLTKVSTK